MEKEIFTCDEFDKIITQNVNLGEKLANIAYYFEKRLKMKVYFCKLFGERWSFYAGTDDVVAGEKKIVLGDDFGMIIENNSFTDDDWEDFKLCINPILKNSDQ
jgi:hypothetical protein